jgi:lipopolysaccharide transport system ATP-binding protein
MSDTIIKVENISKRYRLGLKEKKADTFAQQVVNVLKYPIDNFRRIQNLGKFGEEEEGVHWALKDVSFEVKHGDVLGIIGKNGAGKSTLLKILSKITEPTSGRIEMNGRVAALLEVGTGFHPELSGRENIYMNGTILGMTRREIDRKLDEIIDFSGVEKYIDTPVKFYSSGMRVRLGFSVAAHLEPEILIIDEVLAVGDFEFQKKCLGKMEDVSKNHGRTVLFVSHNLITIQNLCSRSILLNNGGIQNDDKSSLVISDYYKSFSSNDNNTRKLDSSKPVITRVLLNEEKLNSDCLELLVEYSSPFEIDFPVVGFVLYNQDNVPVFGSNSRFHQEKFNPKPLKKGIINCINYNIELHSGTYYISFWLGDKHVDYDYYPVAIKFDYKSLNAYAQLPDLSVIGSIDKIFSWKLKNEFEFNNE